MIKASWQASEKRPRPFIIRIDAKEQKCNGPLSTSLETFIHQGARRSPCGVIQGLILPLVLIRQLSLVTLLFSGNSWYLLSANTKQLSKGVADSGYVFEPLDGGNSDTLDGYTFGGIKLSNIFTGAFTAFQNRKKKWGGNEWIYPKPQDQIETAPRCGIKPWLSKFDDKQTLKATDLCKEYAKFWWAKDMGQHHLLGEYQTEIKIFDSNGDEAGNRAKMPLKILALFSTVSYLTSLSWTQMEQVKPIIKTACYSFGMQAGRGWGTKYIRHYQSPLTEVVETMIPGTMTFENTDITPALAPTAPPPAPSQVFQKGFCFYVRVGAVDKYPIMFDYNGKIWNSNDVKCKKGGPSAGCYEGKYDNEWREIDCCKPLRYHTQ
ncbi:hypothetical protein K469DRAFT_794731 [Zopfia rhizophila CBS 207.26]|uniref:Uncharacterized protein n=1 Tax=Zopfia rhizophila CBS 207.26 TaxID=1314779 RepID=A0A6A6DLJ6_9PEZI|nr:hypothetical protein K469DRAFT_794731 [Zopfia rhizophila CBS 207.26]